MLPRVNLIRTGAVDYLMFATGDAISASVPAQGSWAPLLIDIGTMFCSGTEAPLVLDVGANLGAYAIPVAQKIAAANGTVHAFEPQRIVFYQLCGNIVLNRVENLHAFHSAIGNLEGKILPSATATALTSFGPDDPVNRGGEPAMADGAARVPITRLDRVPLPKAPALIKVSADGAELDVLKGARETIWNSNFPPLMLEVWTAERFAEQRAMLLNYLEEIGYTYVVLGDAVLAQHPDHPRQFHFGSTGAAGLPMTRVK